MEQSAAGWMLGSHTCRWVQCDQTADCTKRYMYRYIVCVYVGHVMMFVQQENNV